MVKNDTMDQKLKELSCANPGWFNHGNKKFFHDVEYMVLHGTNGHPYLVRSTYAWTDMFGGKKTLHYRVNELDANLKIGGLVETQFADMNEVKDWLSCLGEVIYG